MTVWPPTRPKGLAPVEASGWRAGSPRLPEQPIFYLVLNRDYPIKIVSAWHVKPGGAGDVTGFRVREDFLDRYYPVQQAGGRIVLD